MNKKGSAGSLIITLVMVVVSLYVLAALVPGLSESITDMRDDDGLNCKNHIDYNSTRTTDTLGCSMSSLTVGLIVIGVLIAGITMLMYPRREEQYGQPQY